jgi:hypothetical protein
MHHAESTRLSRFRTFLVELSDGNILDPLSCRARTAQVAARKEPNMRMFLTGAAIALALAGTTLATTGTANAAGISIGISDNGRHHASTGITFSFGDVAIGYQDGYWDNSHRWHKWRNRGDHDNYRRQHGDNYRNGYHNRYRDNGWQRH